MLATLLGRKTNSGAVAAKEEVEPQPLSVVKSEPSFVDLKVRLHQQLIDILDLPVVERTPRAQLEAEVGGIVLRHEAVRDDARPEISGHFHPKLRVHLKGRQVSRRCFVVSPTKIILPAFGSLTGGLDAHHPEIMRNVGGDAAALVPVSDRLLRFPLAA